MKGGIANLSSFSRSSRHGLYIILLYTAYLLICNAQVEEVEEGIPIDGIFAKDSPTEAPNNGSINNNNPQENSLPTISPETLSPSQFPSEEPTSYNSTLETMTLVLQESCRLGRDIYCLDTNQGAELDFTGMNGTEREDYILDDLGISYQPLIDATLDYVDSNPVIRDGWLGYTATENSTKYEVRAMAMGLVITSISNIDSIEGRFLTNLRIHLYEITEGNPFSSMAEAFNTIYKDTSMTTRSDNQNLKSYYRLHDEELSGAWEERTTETNETVVPDCVCSGRAMSSMKPIKYDDSLLEEVIRLPHLHNRIWPTAVLDDEGNLRFIEIIGAQFKYKPINRNYFPVQIDLLDIFFDMSSTDLIDEDQHIVNNLLCLHPAYSGFSNHVFGSDKEGGHITSDSLTMIPFLAYDRAEPWLQGNISSHFYYGRARQRAVLGRGSNLKRRLGLRLIVDHPSSKGWFEVLPILFVSIAAMANFVSSSPTEIGATTMVQTLLGVNSLVTQNTQLIGRSTIYGQSLLLAYAIYGLWILTVVIMISINQSKKRQSRNKWYILHQTTIFRYLRLGGWCALIIYIPLLSAYSIDEGNGKQSTKTWAWYLILVCFIIVFSLRAFVDYRLVKKRRCDAEEDLVKVQGLLNKPLEEWDEDDVILWINKANMYRASYFTEAKRHLIEDKLKEAGIDGELLCKYGSDIEKLVNYVGLSVGDAEKVTKELTFLKREDSMSTSKRDSMMEVESALAVKKEKDEA